MSNEHTKELGPCPFITRGGKHSLETKEDANRWKPFQWIVTCWCGATGPQRSTEADAIAAWNSRASVAAPQGDAANDAVGLNLLRQLVSGGNALRQLNVFWCNYAEHDAGCKCFWEQCEVWAKQDAAASLPSGPSPPPEQEHGYWPTLVDRGDGVKGHYCIGRLVKPGEPYWEYWSKGEWSSAGEVFIGREAAEAQLESIRKSTGYADPLDNDAVDNELRRWQDGIRDKLIDLGAPDWKIDGAGCDSGDPLDFTLAEVGQGVGYFIDQLEELRSAPPSTQPSARVAAEEIARLPTRNAYATDEVYREVIESIISRHFPVQPVEERGSALDEIEVALISIADGVSPHDAVQVAFNVINRERQKLIDAAATADNDDRCEHGVSLDQDCLTCENQRDEINIG